MSVKISILCNTSWYIYNFRSSLIKELINRGYDVLTIAPIDEYTSRLEEMGCIHIPILIDSSSKNPLKDVRTIFQLNNILSNHKPEVLLNYTAKANIYGTLVANYLGIPTINNVAGLGLGFVNETLVTKLLRFLYNISQERASVVFFQNPTDYDDFISRGISSPEKSKVLPGSGVDLDHFEFCELPNLEQNTFKFILVSRMLYSKGVYILLEASKLLYEKGFSNFSIQLLGDIGVNNRDAIPASVIEEWNQKPYVNYLGRTDDVRTFIKEAHCMILPTYYKEGTPRSILEGLAMGRPIVTTNTPGCRNTVANGKNGFLIEPKNKMGLFNKMKHMLTLNESELKNMGSISRSIAENKFDEEIVTRSYLKEVNKLI